MNYRDWLGYFKGLTPAAYRNLSKEEQDFLYLEYVKMFVMCIEVEGAWYG